MPTEVGVATGSPSPPPVARKSAENSRETNGFAPEAGSGEIEPEGGDREPIFVRPELHGHTSLTSQMFPADKALGRMNMRPI